MANQFPWGWVLAVPPLLALGANNVLGWWPGVLLATISILLVVAYVVHDSESRKRITKVQELKRAEREERQHDEDVHPAEEEETYAGESEIEIKNAEDKTIHRVHGSTLRGAFLGNAYLHGAMLQRAQLAKANLRDADLREADLTEADLRGADLTDANLGGCNLANADLRGAILTNASFRGATLRNADMRHVENGRRSKLTFRGADMQEVDLSGTYLLDVDLSLANLRNAKLADSELLRVNLALSDLRGVTLKDAVVRLTVVDGTNLKGVRLDEALEVSSLLTGSSNVFFQCGAIFNRETRWPPMPSLTPIEAIGAKVILKWMVRCGVVGALVGGFWQGFSGDLQTIAYGIAGAAAGSLLGIPLCLGVKLLIAAREPTEAGVGLR